MKSAARERPRPNRRPPPPGADISAEDLQRLRDRLDEAEQALAAIRNGEVDAIMVNGANGDHVYSLAGAEQPYRVYLECMQEGAVSVSEDGVILYCNRRFATMVNRPLERVIGSELGRYLSDDGWRCIADIFREPQRVVKCETILRRETDSGLPVNLTASRLSPDGMPLMCLVVTDLTGQKETNDLRLAKEIAERASASKDDFLAALSHELRTPLTPALMAATVLEKDTGIPESARSDIALIRRNIELEARLIDDLLDLTLISRGKLQLHQEDVNVHAALNRAVEVCQADARQKHLSLQLGLGARPAVVRGDPVRMQQVFWNLLRNAVKFTPERGTIAITTGNSGNNVWIRMQDNGLGFPPDQGARIFEAFEQANRQVARQFGGLGLGLAISRAIVRAHGGDITAQSSGLHQGATFMITFPLANESSPAVAAAPTPARNAGQLNILLVEDHKDTRACVQRLLEAQSHRILSAGTAEAALKLAEANRFDLVISDLGLPDLTGHELMRRLHARHGLPGIALSGYGMEHDVEASKQAGFKYHLTKPVSFDRLKSFVAEFAANRQKG